MAKLEIKLLIDKKEVFTQKGIIMDDKNTVYDKKIVYNSYSEGFPLLPSHGKRTINDVYKEVLKKYGNEKFELNINIKR
ncbi:MAG: hypothetical protein AABW81_00945 [Nanoarchaeota archaeon]